MEFTWTNPTLNNIPAEGHYVIGDFNNALFIELVKGYKPVNWIE